MITKRNFIVAVLVTLMALTVVSGAGVVSAQVTTRELTLVGHPNVPAGQTFAVSGNYKEDGVAKEGVTVSIYSVVTDSGGTITTTFLADGTTDVYGVYEITIGPYPAGDYSFVATNAGSPDAPPPFNPTAVSDTLSVHVVVPSTVTTVAVDPATITVGEAFVVGGTVTKENGDAVTEGSVDLYLQRPGETTFSYWRHTIFNPSSTGQFSVSPVPDASLTAGTYQIKAKYLGTANFLASESEPVTLTVTTAVTKDTVLLDLQGLQGTISQLALDQSNFKNKNSAKTLNNELDAVIKQINAGRYTNAIDKLQTATLTKVDGCANAGTPDKNDLIVKCPTQTTVYTELNGIIKELQALQGS